MRAIEGTEWWSALPAVQKSLEPAASRNFPRVALVDGNQMFNRLYHRLFGRDFTDIFSGYRVFTRRFVKSFPAVSGGFEIETEMSVHASQLRLPVTEIALDYGRRPEGSTSKLSTFRDGAKILFMFAMLMKETRPFAFFGLLSAFAFALSAAFVTPVLLDYFATGLVPRLPTFVFASVLALVGLLFAIAGTVLDSVARGRAETKRMLYLALQPARGERAAGLATVTGRRSADRRESRRAA